MQQKKNQSTHPFSAALHPSGGEGGEDEEEDDESAMDPFRDGDDDIDDDDDDDLNADVAQDRGRGAWWRSMVGRKTHNVDDSDEGDQDDDDEEEEEFGDFAMAEDDKSSSGEVIVDNLVLRPLPVNPAKESSRGLSGLWPFASRSDSKTRRQDDKEEPSADDDTAAGEDDKAVEVKEATNRTTIEEPDEDEVEVVGDCV